jgi:hypothetical protein
MTLAVFFVVGCGQDKKAAESPRFGQEAKFKKGGNMGALSALANDADGGEIEAQAKAPEGQVPRKIIYTAQVDLVVEEFEKAEQELQQFVQEQKAYVARSDMHGSPGSPRSGTWTIRVPVDRFDGFIEAVGKLGELQRSRTDSEDITDKYYDLRAHLKNNETEEEGLRKLYLEKSATGKLEDLLAVRRELKGVRGEIEQQKGQLQRWDKQTEYATVTVKMDERKGYVPTTTPAFGTSISRAFVGSFDALVSAGKAIVLVVVVLTPWLPVVVIIGVAIWLGVRQQKRRGILSVAPIRPSEPANPS